MANKYKIALTTIGICLLLSIAISIDYNKYQNKKDLNPLVVVNSGLSINYRSGNQIKINNQTKTYSFSVTNNNENATLYYIELENLKNNKESTRYKLEEKNGELNIDAGEITNVNTNLADYIEITPGTTHFYELTIYEEEKLSLTADLKVELVEQQEEYFANTILKNNKPEKSPKTKVGEVAAVENEGLIESIDDYGTSYYFRGNVPNNYVEFAGKTWRIVKINGDGSVKLVLNDYIENNINFYDNNTASIEKKLEFPETRIYKTLSDWYKENLEKNEEYLAFSKFCVDDSVRETNGGKTYYLANSRLLIDYSQTGNCLGKHYATKIGLLTADEAVFAGATKNSDNTNFYLYNSSKNASWWTLTPSSSDAEDITFFEISSNGKLQAESMGTLYRAIKPVINVTKKTRVEGTGTEADPYKVKNDLH